MKKLLSLVCLTLFGFLAVEPGAVAQGYVVIGGKIIDKTTREAVPFARIGVLSKGVGTIANENGEFYLRFAKILSEENIVISVLGYKNFTRKGSEFTTNDRKLVLELEPAEPLVLTDSVVAGVDGRKLMAAVFKKIPANSVDYPATMTGYYQETLQQNGDYVDIREAVLKLEKDPRPKIDDREKIRMLRGRRFLSSIRNKALEEYEFPNGTAIVTRGLPAGGPEYLAGGNLADYTFQLSDTSTYFNDAEVLRIRFSPASPSVRGARAGMFFVNKADSAIVRIQYDFSPSGMDDIFKSTAKNTLGKIMSKNRREARRVSSYTNYLPYNGKWTLQDSQLLIETDFMEKTGTINAVIRLHFVANDIIKSNGNAIPKSDPMLEPILFPLQSIPKYDEVYWANFNHIIPSADMRKIIETLKK
jgi:hypothetical protein